MSLRTWIGLRESRQGVARPSVKKKPLPPQVAAWYEGKEFSNDWTTRKLARWFPILEPYSADRVSILEIGSWEGRSAIAFLEILPEAHLTCVDTFEGSPNHLAKMDLWKEQLSLVEQRFDANLGAYAGRFRKMVGRGVAIMDQLRADGEQFDIIYIDGSHRRDDVLADSVVAWPLLKVGGLMMWDDIRFHLEWEASERPADALAMFGAMFGDCMQEVHRGSQLLARKLRCWPDKYRVPSPE